MKLNPDRLESESSLNDDLKSISITKLMKKIGPSPDDLTQVEAEKWLTQYGPNEIAEKRTNEIPKFLAYFWRFIP